MVDQILKVIIQLIKPYAIKTYNISTSKIRKGKELTVSVN